MTDSQLCGGGCAAVVRILVVLMLTWFGFDTVALHFTAEAWCLIPQGMKKHFWAVLYGQFEKWTN